MSSPASADGTVEWVAPQSEVTKPGKCHWFFRTPRMSVFSHAYWPLMVEAGVAPSTISGVVQDLMAAGLVVASSRPSDIPQPGRPGLRLTLNPRLGGGPGGELCFDNVRVLLYDPAHECIRTAARQLPHADSK